MIYDVFISYRRDGGFETAKHLNDLLVRDGYSVSFDIDTLREGFFDNTLLERIEQCSDFLLVVNKDAFVRTLDPKFDSEKDWLRRELAYALQLKKNIIPILLAGATFPDRLPDDVEKVRFKNGPVYSKDYFDTFYAKLKDFMHALPRRAPVSDYGVESPAVANLKIKCDLDCVFYLDGEERLQLTADQLQKIPLSPGEYELAFVGTENPADHLVQDLEMQQVDKLLKVSLKEIRNKRLEKEAEEKRIADEKRREEEKRKEEGETQRKAEEEERRFATSDREFTVSGVSFKMIYVEGGTFQMGSEDSDAYGNEKPAHPVTLSNFHIGETPVTQALWKTVMGSNPSHFKGDNQPVEKVSWNDCQEFIQKLNRLTGKTFRLPTEAEWEYAARGGKHHSPHKYAGSNSINEVAWYDDFSGGKTHPVKTKKPNALGVYDMSGNVYEWCQDWYNDYSGSAQTDPKGPSKGSRRILRGGSWGYSAWRCRVSYRSYNASDRRVSSCGFRLALVH